MKDKDYTQFLTMTPSEFRKRNMKQGWALSLIGFIVYAALLLSGHKPNNYKGICPYFEVGSNWGGFSMGWFFVCCKKCGDATKRHEVGHGIQNAAVGGLKMIGYSIGSVARYLYRRIFGAKTLYDSWFFEGDATRLGTEYVRNHAPTDYKE